MTCHDRQTVNLDASNALFHLELLLVHADLTDEGKDTLVAALEVLRTVESNTRPREE